MFPPQPCIALRHLYHSPDGDGCHAVGEDGEEGRGGLGVEGPAQAGGAPQLEEVT